MSKKITLIYPVYNYPMARLLFGTINDGFVLDVNVSIMYLN